MAVIGLRLTWALEVIRRRPTCVQQVQGLYLGSTFDINIRSEHNDGSMHMDCAIYF